LWLAFRLADEAGQKYCQRPFHVDPRQPIEGRMMLAAGNPQELGQQRKYQRNVVRAAL
jgi:hypothetical protein